MDVTERYEHEICCPHCGTPYVAACYETSAFRRRRKVLTYVIQQASLAELNEDYELVRRGSGTRAEAVV